MTTALIVPDTSVLRCDLVSKREVADIERAGLLAWVATIPVQDLREQPITLAPADRDLALRFLAAECSRFLDAHITEIRLSYRVGRVVALEADAVHRRQGTGTGDPPLLTLGGDFRALGEQYQAALRYLVRHQVAITQWHQRETCRTLVRLLERARDELLHNAGRFTRPEFAHILLHVQEMQSLGR